LHLNLHTPHCERLLARILDNAEARFVSAFGSTSINCVRADGRRSVLSKRTRI